MPMESKTGIIGIFGAACRERKYEQTGPAFAGSCSSDRKKHEEVLPVIKMEPEQLRQFAAETEELRTEASRTSVREAGLHYLQRAASSTPDHRLQGGWTAEEVTERLIGEMNAMTNSPQAVGSESSHRLQTTIRKIIVTQQLDAEQARQYVALVGVLLDEMTGTAQWADPEQARDAFGKKYQARMNKYADLPLEEQINRLTAETEPGLKPALTRKCYLYILQNVLKSLKTEDQGKALSEMAELCADRENALFLAAMNYAKDAVDPRIYHTSLDPAAYLRSAAYQLDVIKACSLELSGSLTKSEVIEEITQNQEETCTMLAGLVWFGTFVGGTMGAIELGGMIYTQLGLYWLGGLVCFAGAVLSLCLGLYVADAANSIFEQLTKLWNSHQYIKRLDAETLRDEETASRYSDLIDSLWEDDEEKDIIFQID